MGCAEAANFLFQPELLALPFCDLGCIRRGAALPFLDFIREHLVLLAKFCQMRRNGHFVLLYGSRKEDCSTERESCHLSFI